VRNVFVGLLWLWLLASLGIYAYRLYRRFTREPTPDADETRAGPPAAPDVPIIGSVAPAPARPSSTATPPSTPAPAPMPTASGPSPNSDAPAAGRTDSPSTARAGLFAPAGSAPNPAVTTAGASGSESRPTVADVLHGIVMPCDLSPIVDPDRVIDPYRVAFSTNTAPAATIGAAVGDELERLEFTLASTATNQLAATKAGQRVVVTIHPDPEQVTYGDGQAFRTIPPGSVVVEFQT
jgi:hypothetical protein